MSETPYPTHKELVCRNCQFEGYMKVLDFMDKDLAQYGSLIWEIAECLSCHSSHLITSIYDDEVVAPPEIKIPDFSSSSVNLKNLFGKPSPDDQFKCDVFMVMPFDDAFKPVYRQIKQIVNSKNLSIKRGDDFFANQTIMKDIWSALSTSKLVIADCTGKNANVFYELGIAHAIGCPAILISQNRDDIPFDVIQIRNIEYNTNNLQVLNKPLSDAIEKILSR